MRNPKITIETTNIESETPPDHQIRADINVERAEQGLFAIAFHLEYDPESLKYLKHESGNFFEQSARPIYLVKQKDNKIIFGETLKKADQLAYGEGRVVSFYFQPLKEETSKLNFQNQVLSSFQEQRTDITADWQNTDLQVNSLNTGLSYWPLIIIIALTATLYCLRKIR